MTDKRKLVGNVNKERYGEDFYQKIGAKGGAAPYEGKKGFSSMTPEQRREAGRRGGLKSRKRTVE